MLLAALSLQAISAFVAAIVAGVLFGVLLLLAFIRALG
jgi:hypothetical protein